MKDAQFPCRIGVVSQWLLKGYWGHGTYINVAASRVFFFEEYALDGWLMRISIESPLWCSFLDYSTIFYVFVSIWRSLRIWMMSCTVYTSWIELERNVLKLIRSTSVLFHWHVICVDSCNDFSRPDILSRLSSLGLVSLLQWYRCIGCATVIMLQKWYENSQCPKCPMVKFDLNKFFSWIFTFGFTGKTPWTTTN